MSDKVIIHVFIGAPIAVRYPPQETCKHVCECCFFHKGQWLDLQSNNPSNTQNNYTLYGGVQTWQKSLCSVTGREVVAHSSAFSFSREKFNSQKIGFKTEHVSTANHCSRRPVENLLYDSLDLSVHEKNEDSTAEKSQRFSTTSAENEFLTNTQVAVHCQNTETSKMRMLEKLTSLTVIGLNKDLRDNSTCKRKTTFMETLYLPSRDQVSKKSKQSNFSVKCVSMESNQTPPSNLKFLTPLKHCSDKKNDYNILAVVLQPCHVKEIQVKSEQKCGSSFPLATIIVLDQSEVKCKVLMWKNAAFHSLALFPGDIIRLTNLTVCEDKWNKETFLQATFKSHLLNLGNCFRLTIDDYSNTLEYFVLQELLNYIFTNHCYLRDIFSPPPQKLDCLQHVELLPLHPELLVHSILKVSFISILKEFTYNLKGLQQTKVILTVEDIKGHIGSIILSGTSVSWYEQICLKLNHIWDFKFLFCKKSLISGEVELHTTPWSSCECLFDDDKRAMDFQRKYQYISSRKLRGLRTITEGRYSGDIHIKVSISELEFHISDNQSIILNKQTSLTKILNSLLSVVYSGCGKCRNELKIDSNYVYEQCFICLPFNTVRLFYRPALMTVYSKDDDICVHVSSAVLEKIFLNISPNLIHRLVSGSSNVTYGAIVADTCFSLLADDRESSLLTIKAHYLPNENSKSLEQEFHVLAFVIHL